MLFNSYVFIFLFLPVTFLGFLALGGRGLRRAAILWVVLASFFFYGWWDPKCLWLIGVSMLFNYMMGVRLSQRTKTPKGKMLLTFAVAANLLLLAHYKYTDFLILNFNSFFGSSLALQKIVLPLGISFFTFTQIAYLVDAYRGETKEYNLLDYTLFVVFFPHLIAGPIIHHRDVIPQFSRKGVFSFNAEYVSVGLTIFILGLFKKAVFADGIAKYSTPVFELAKTGEAIGFYNAWGGVLAYTLQIYFDFSGYSDMAIGLAKMFGVRFPVNFNSPYKAVNIVEFWRRWHMTLSRFLRDYLYIPLGGNRLGPTRRHVNLFLTMLIGGLWHGAGWTFVIWGALHGLYLVVNHAWHGIRRSLGHDLHCSTVPGRFAATLLTFLGVIIAWVFFRAETLGSALALLKSMSGFSGFGATGLAVRQLVWTAGLLGIVWFLPNTQEMLARFTPALDFPATDTPSPQRGLEWRPNRVWAAIIAGVFLISVLHLCKITEFLYFQF